VEGLIGFFTISAVRRKECNKQAFLVILDSIDSDCALAVTSAKTTPTTAPNIHQSRIDARQSSGFPQICYSRWLVHYHPAPNNAKIIYYHGNACSDIHRAILVFFRLAFMQQHQCLARVNLESSTSTHHSIFRCIHRT